jgi:hypothetical protein
MTTMLHRSLILALLLASTAQACAAESARHVWLISTRGKSHCGNLESPQDLCYRRLDENGQWLPADAEMFRAADDESAPTVVFIHGNQTDAQEAVTKAWYVYETIRAEADGRPFRYVIWSWPAERMIRSHRADVRLKAAYSDADSYYLAEWLDRLRPGVRVSLIGHSFGPRIITGALGLLAGGEVAGRTMPESSVAAWKGGKRNALRAVLLAAAVDADWPASESCRGRTLALANDVLITRNACDPVLRHYPKMDGRGGPQALGAVGPRCADDAKNVAVLDVSCTVGKTHDWRCYCAAVNLPDVWRHYTFLEDVPARDQP